MICPNCGREMKSIDSRYVGFGDEPDYDLYEHTGDECRKCRIKYDNHYNSWILPDSLKPTEKQIRTVLFIQNRLNIHVNNLVTKKQYCEFIGKYFDVAKNTKKLKYDACEFDYEEYGYTEEFY